MQGVHTFFPLTRKLDERWDLSPLAGTGEATPGILHLVLGSPVHENDEHTADRTVNFCYQAGRAVK